MEGTVQKRVRVAWTSFLLFFVALFLTAYSARNPDVARAGSSALAEVQRPLQLGNQVIVNFFGGFWTNYINLVNVRSEQSDLQSRIKELESDLAALREAKVENEQLRALLELREDSSLTGTVARVIGYDASNWVQAITVDRGSRHGVKLLAPVVMGDGLVGKVISVSTGSSRVLLITDHGSGVDALIQRNRARGILVGAGRGRAVLRYVEREQNVVKGDRVISSGLDGLYPKGLTLGEVVRVRQESLFHIIDIRPKIDFSKLETVMIVQNSPTFALEESEEEVSS